MSPDIVTQQIDRFLTGQERTFPQDDGPYNYTQRAFGSGVR